MCEGGGGHELKLDPVGGGGQNIISYSVGGREGRSGGHKSYVRFFLGIGGN